MKHLIVLMVVVACAGKKDQAPPAVGSGSASATGSGSSAAAAPDPACADKAAKLQAWLRDLVADGTRAITTSANVVVLDGVASAPLAQTPVINVGPHEVTYEGKLVSVLPIKDKGKALHAMLAATPTAPDTVAVVVDAAVPWSDVATVANAAAAAKRTHLTFVFAAGAPGKVAPPPPSAVDAELDAYAKPDPARKATKLADPKDPNFKSIPDKIFKDCDVKTLFETMGKTDNKDKLITDGLPDAIKACGCKVEIASVQRLLWAWYGHDSGPALVGITVELGGKGKPVTAKPAAAWSESSKAVVAAAKAGKPISIK